MIMYCSYLLQQVLVYVYMMAFLWAISPVNIFWAQPSGTARRSLNASMYDLHRQRPSVPGGSETLAAG